MYCRISDSEFVSSDELRGPARLKKTKKTKTADKINLFALLVETFRQLHLNLPAGGWFPRLQDIQFFNPDGILPITAQVIPTPGQL